LKVSANVKIAVQCFEIFEGENAPNVPPWLRACLQVTGRALDRFRRDKRHLTHIMQLKIQKNYCWK